MLHLLLRSFPEFLESLIFALYFSLESIFLFSHRGGGGGVFFHEGILSKSQTASLMVINLPDVTLLTMTPPNQL